jgi:hypothetical protein
MKKSFVGCQEGAKKGTKGKMCGGESARGIFFFSFRDTCKGSGLLDSAELKMQA